MTVVVYDVFTVADMVSATSGGTFVGNVAMSGTLGVTGATTTAAITASGVVDITNTTDASDDSGDTGALRVEGGASIAKKLYVGTDLDVDGTANLDVVDIDGALTQDGGAVFNEASADVDFRVESNGDANCLFVDGGNDEVGIGTNTPSSHSSPNGAKLVVNTSGATFLQLNGGSSASCGVEFTDGAAAGQIHYYHGDNSLNFSAQGASSGLSLLASGNVNIADGNLVVASGHGIDFSATGDGSATDTSELLDDYEEGTWVPTITGSSNPSFSTSVAAGKYIKVGNLVFVQWNMIITGVSSQGSGNAQVGGLPYASNCNTYQGHIGIMYNDVWDTEIQKGYVPNGQSHIQLAPDGRTQSNFGFASTLGTGYFGGGGSYITG